MSRPLPALQIWPRARHTTAPSGAELIVELSDDIAVDAVKGPIVQFCAAAREAGRAASTPTNAKSPTRVFIG
jgi:hypothetical protein